MIQQQVEAWQGPIPRPQDLVGYANVDPGFPERIIKMAEKTLELTEKQANHRMTTEATVVRAWNLRALLGLIFAFVLAVVVLGGSAWLIYAGDTVGGSVLGGADLASLVGVFIYGRSDQRKPGSF